MTEASDKKKGYWAEALHLVQLLGWVNAEKEIIQRISALKYSSAEQEDIQAYLLVLATLQQKFGHLDSAEKILSDLEGSPSKIIADDATVRLGKLFSQKGKFNEAQDKLLSLLPREAGTSNLWTYPEKVSPSILWRIGFLKGINGEYKESKYWLEKHLDYTSSHGSQYANNTIFKNVFNIANDTYDLTASIDNNEIGFNFYLKDSLSVKNVKYVNVSKSAVVPLILDGVIKLKIHDNYSAILQFLLCRRLMGFEGLTIQSEGIAETIYSLKNGNDKLTSKVISHFNENDEVFFKCLTDNDIIDTKVLSYIIGMREEIFQQFIIDRDYTILSISGFKKTFISIGIKNMKKITDIFIIHGHDELNLYRLKEFIKDEINLNAVVLKDYAGKGKTLIEKFEELASKTQFAIALFTKDDLVNKNGKKYLQPRPNVIFEIGWFYGKLGRDKVVIIYQDGVTLPSDLDGLSTINFSENILDKAIEIKREVI